MSDELAKVLIAYSCDWGSGWFIARTDAVQSLMGSRLGHAGLHGYCLLVAWRLCIVKHKSTVIQYVSTQSL